MKKVSKKIAMLFLLTFYVVFFSTGCLDKKINKTDYKLDEVRIIKENECGITILLC